MAPRFISSRFKFEKGETIPEHEECWAFEGERDPSLWHVNGYDRFSHEHYELASDLGSLEEAEIIKEAAKRHIKSTQIATAGFHDDVYVVRPRVSTS